jgi:hypothetical protein
VSQNVSREVPQLITQNRNVNTLLWEKWHDLNSIDVHWVYTFLILRCTSLCPQNSLNLSGPGLYKVSKAFHIDAGSRWLQCFPQLCVVGSMSFGWWNIIDTHRKLLSVKNPVALQFLTHSNRCAWHLLPYPFQRHLHLYIVHSPSEWHTFTIHVWIVSRLKKKSFFNLSPPLHLHWLKWI